MPEKIKNNKRHIILLFLILIVLVISFSYAYYEISKTSPTANTGGTKCFSATFTEENAEINRSGEYPISDAEGKETIPFTFTITNTCTMVAGYQINLDVLSTNTLGTQYIKAVLNKGVPKVLNGGYDPVTPTVSGATSSYMLKQGVLAPSASVTYDLRIWMADVTPQGVGFNSIIATKIVIVSSPVVPIEFVKNFGGSSVDYFNSVQETSDGGYIAVGNSSSTNDDLTGLNKGGTDAIIVKYNSSGNVIWNKNFGGSGYEDFNSVQVTSDGGYIAVGNSNSTNGDLTGLNKGDFDATIVKYDGSGNVLWNKNFGGSLADYFYSVQETGDGGYIAVGYSNSANEDLAGLYKGGSDAIIVKYDSSGNVLWNKNFGGSSGDYFNFVQVTSDSGYIAVGYSGSTNGDLTGLNKGGSSDAIIVKYNSSGTVEWNKNFGGGNIDEFSGVASTSDGGYIVVGHSYSTDGDLTGLNKGNYDAIIVKYDSNGNILWNKNFGGSNQDYFYDVVLTSDGGYIAVGQSSSSNGDLTGLNKSSNDAIIVKYDSSGNVEWNKNFGGGASDSFHFVQVTSDGGYIAVGYSDSNNDDLTGLNKGSTDAIIVKGIFP